MRCQDIQDRLLDGLKHPLPEGFEEHLETCPECRELWEVWQALGTFPPPDPELGARFRMRLQRECPRPEAVAHRLAGWGLPLAATLLLALGGAFAAGYALRGDREPSSPLARLKRGSPADRMQAIALATPIRDGNAELAGALLERVMRDPSPEVRLSAVEALYLFGSDPGLGQRLANALPQQDSPRVQLAMVDLMVALKERRAAESLRRLLRDGSLAPEVRRRAEAHLAQQSL